MAAPKAELQAVPDPTPEPIVDDVEGVIHPTLGQDVRLKAGEPDPRWTLAYRIREAEQTNRGLENDLRSKRAQITVLQRKRLDAAESERQANPEREAIQTLFAEWGELSGHTRAKLTPERFDMAAERLAEGYSIADLRMAIHGLIAGAWRDEKGVLHDDWKVAMKSGEQVERYANLCPAERRNEIRGTLFEVAS